VLSVFVPVISCKRSTLHLGHADNNLPGMRHNYRPSVNYDIQFLSDYAVFCAAC
jgi:hypothetical protein